MKNALIIIDMQQGSFARGAPLSLVERLNRLASGIRATGGVVIFVQHDGPEGDPQHPDLPGWQLLPDLSVAPGDIIVRKTSCDAFLDTSLDALLEAHDVQRLIITGSATEYCVDTTVRSALARGYPTIVPVDGHTTANRPHLPADKIIEHHHAIWSDFLAPAGPAVLCPCSGVPLS